MITVETIVAAPRSKVWDCWTNPEHIVHWNNASDDWCTPAAQSDLRPGGRFVYRMEATDGSMGFDFTGTFDELREHELIRYTIADNRKVEVEFGEAEGGTSVVERFEAEQVHSEDLQRQGWQAILNHFKHYVESLPS
jgi:uncharacterized protein YndB with AHSA1/START domain